METTWGTSDPDPRPGRLTDTPATDHALIYVPAEVTHPEDFARLAAPCLERVEACGYTFAGVVRVWDDAMELTRSGLATVVVVPSLAYLPHDRRPRVEAAGDPVRADANRGHHTGPDVRTTRNRRPRVLR